jgi:small subunit ribosomal protein S17
VSEPQEVIADAGTTVDAPAVLSATSALSGTSATSEPAAKKRGERKTREGMVVSDKMDKTIVVELEDRVKHPRYSKVIRRTTKVKAHDENGTAGIGDRVLLAETRPLSATKRWRLVQVLERAQ